ncbi:hypothetical protein [Nocardia macrotermitis]|nr:hypothetical protein [Nocardia macrotermitis]
MSTATDMRPKRIGQALGLPFGDPKEVALYTNDLTGFRPVERRVDTLLKVTTAEDGEFMLAAEAQGEKDADKPAAPAYWVTPGPPRNGVN